MTEKLAIWSAAALLLCTTAPVSTAQADSVPLKSATLQGDEVIQTPIGDIDLVDNYFDDDASKRLFDEMDYQRAAQSYVWSTPLVSITTWRDNQAAAFGVENDTDFVVLEFSQGEAGHRHRKPHDAVHLQLHRSLGRSGPDRLSRRSNRGRRPGFLDAPGVRSRPDRPRTRARVPPTSSSAPRTTRRSTSRTG